MVQATFPWGKVLQGKPKPYVMTSAGHLYTDLFVETNPNPTSSTVLNTST